MSAQPFAYLWINCSISSTLAFSYCKPTKNQSNIVSWDSISRAAKFDISQPAGLQQVRLFLALSQPPVPACAVDSGSTKPESQSRVSRASSLSAERKDRVLKCNCVYSDLTEGQTMRSDVSAALQTTEKKPLGRRRHGKGFSASLRAWWVLPKCGDDGFPL